MGKRVCLIDYENTALAGLDGLENLSAGDWVRIICSNESIGNTLLHILSIYQDREITVEVEYMNQRGSNALDFRLSTDLGYFIAQGDVEQIYVVSKDKGYLHAISEASALNSDVLIVCGVSIRDALIKVEHGITELPIEDYIKPCKDAKEADAALRMEWQQTKSAKESGVKTVKALEIIKQKMPVVGKKKPKETKSQESTGQVKQETESKHTKPKKDSKPPKANTEGKQAKAKTGEKQAKAKIGEKPAKSKKENQKSPSKQEAIQQPKTAESGKKKNTEKKAGNTKPKVSKKNKDARSKEDIEALTNAQRKKLQQEIKKHIEQTTAIETNYSSHIAALVVKENSVMEFRRAVKKALGKKYDAAEAEAVGVYMHFRLV